MESRKLRIYDTLTRSLKAIEPLEPRHLRFYCCGPTVYNYAHIGNFRTFLSADLVVRTAEALGWRVSYVSNITDVGHLTEDDVADAGGEDRMEKALRSKEGERFVNVWDLASHYIDALKRDWRSLNLREPMVRPRATEHLREQILGVQSLIEKGHAYVTDSGVYFNVSSFRDYGRLSGNRDQDSLMRAVREVVQDDNKRHPADFALWKHDEKHLMQFYSPWGWGFPGWHIECSVMAMKYLGETIDLHAGGEDLVFPHHECEIAQSEALTGKPFSRQWMHTRFLQVDGERMSKSKGNFYTVHDLIEGKGVSPLALRYALISVPYSKPLNFTMQTLRDAEQAVERLRLCDEVSSEAATSGGDGEDAVGKSLKSLYEEALDAMCDDLNTSVALAKVYEGTRVILREQSGMSQASGRSGQEFLQNVQGLLGIVRPEYETCAGSSTDNGADLDEDGIEERIRLRAEAKARGDYAAADAIRDELAAEGIELRDSPEGTKWKRKSPLEA